MEKFKVAFVGFRHSHIDGLYNRMKDSDQYTIVAACEENAEAAAAAKERGIDITFDDFHEMMQQCEFDILAIGDYFGIRGARAISGLVAGKHVIADKPLCTSLDELQKIRALAKEKNLAIGIMLDMRSNKNVAAAKKLIDEGLIGRIHQIQFTGQHPLSWGSRPAWYFESGKHGGTINDIAIHGTDLTEYLTGHKIKELCAARAWNAYASAAPNFKDSAQGMYVMDDGCGVIFDVSYAAPSGCKTPYYWQFRIWGEKGVLDFHCTSDGVTAYLVNGGEGKVYPASEPMLDYYTSFIAEVEGNKGEWGTEDFLSVTESTLRLQNLSDIHYGPEE